MTNKKGGIPKHNNLLKAFLFYLPRQCIYKPLTLSHSERPKLYGVLAVLSAAGLNIFQKWQENMILVSNFND